jgi:hypothetical protein
LLHESVGIFGLRVREVQKEVGRQSLPHQLCRPQFQRAIISRVMLDTKTAIEANAATSRRISVISVSLSLYVFILFSSCSKVNPKKP